jgi:ABC-2 type transport system ATP-binding protein
VDYAVVVKGLRKTYGSTVAVDDFHLSIRKGEIVGLLGHNGAGKSTALECMLGIRKLDAGSVELLGANPQHSRKELFQRVGVQFQETGYPDKIRVGEMCEAVHSLYREPADWRELLQTFGLGGMEKKPVSGLSGGERQKLSVLLALIPKPELVFLDELTTGLDPGARREVWKHLRQLKEQGMTVLLTSHYMDEVEALCGRICILKKGKVVAAGTIQEIVQDSPAQALEEAYLWYTGGEVMANEGL